MNYNNSELSKKDEYLLSNISNMVDFAYMKNKPQFTDYLDERQQLLAKHRLNKLKFDSYLFYGGTQNCQRAMLGVFPFGEEPSTNSFPIAKIKLEYSEKVELSHRDCLGSLMGLQIERDSIGDIVLTKSFAVIYATYNIASFIQSNLSKIGKANVSVSICEDLDIEITQEYQQIKGTVSSLRLDCVIAMILSKSRGIAVKTIESQLVKVNYFDVSNISHKVNPGDVIVVRGKGKYIVGDNVSVTKKDRFHIIVNKLL